MMAPRAGQRRRARAPQPPGGVNSGWSSSRSQLPSGCLRATCARAPALSRATVAVSALPR